MSVETWRIIPEYSDYEVSSLGRVRRCTPNKLGRDLGRIIKPKVTQSCDSVEIFFTKDGVQKCRILARVVCAAFHGNNSEKDAHHIDGNFQNNCADNLKWGDGKSLVVDQKERGTFGIGSKNGNTSLTEADVVFIRHSSLSNVDLGRKFNVADNTISVIRSRINWKHVL